MNTHNELLLSEILETVTAFFQDLPEDEEFGCGCFNKRISDKERAIYIGLRKKPVEPTEILSYMNIFKRGLED